MFLSGFYFPGGAWSKVELSGARGTTGFSKTTDCVASG